MHPKDPIRCRHTVTGRECEFPREAVPAWRAVGWLPVDEWPTDPPAEPDTPAAQPEPTSTSRKRAAEPKE